MRPDVAARIFVSSYVSFLYGGRAATGVSPIGHSLFEQLSDARSTATPAELTRTLVVRDLTVSPDDKRSGCRECSGRRRCVSALLAQFQPHL